MLGSSTLFFLGIILRTAGFVLEAGATSAVKTIKMSAKLVADQPVGGAEVDQQPLGCRRMRQSADVHLVAAFSRPCAALVSGRTNKSRSTSSGGEGPHPLVLYFTFLR
jgi:hypothetical protein